MSNISGISYNNSSLLKTSSPVTPSKPHNMKDVKSAASDTFEKAAKEKASENSPLELNRQDRIKIAIDKAGMNASKYVQTGTAAFTGMMVGTGLAFALVGGVTPVAVGAGLGVLGGVLMHETGLDTKLDNAVNKVTTVALMPFVLGARRVKKTFRRMLNKLKTKNNSNKTQNESTASEEKTADKADKIKVSDKNQTDVKISSPSSKGLKKSGTGVLSSNRQGKPSVYTVLSRGLGTLTRLVRAFPDFIYPSIINATDAEKTKIIGVLDDMPMKTVTSTGSITVDPNLAKNHKAAGLARDLIFDKPITMDRRYLNMPGRGEKTLIHELGHTRDFSESAIPFVGRSAQGPWGKEPYIFDPFVDTVGKPPYASTNRYEDFAQSYYYYHADPDKLKAVSMEKFQDLEKLHEPSLTERFLEKSGLRDVGKKTAEVIDKVPHLRTGLNVMSAVVGPMEIHRGAHRMKDGIKDANITKKYEGKLSLAQGIGFTNKMLAPLGLGIAISRFVTDRKIRKGKWTPEKADRFATRVLAAMTGPVGLTYLAAIKELSKSDNDQQAKTFKYKNASLKELVSAKKKGLPQERTSVMLASTGEKIDAKDTKLTKGDKVHIAKVGGGALLGGSLGTAAGWISGGAAGALAASVVGLPLLAGAGALLGAMFLSHKGAQIGAKAGRLISKPEQILQQESKKPASKIDKD